MNKGIMELGNYGIGELWKGIDVGLWMRVMVEF